MALRPRLDPTGRSTRPVLAQMGAELGTEIRVVTAPPGLIARLP